MTNLDKDMSDFAKVWDINLRRFWGEDYPGCLAGLMRVHGARSVLDCAGGTGFPVFELKRLGWDVTYSDGSPAMLEFFMNKMEQEHLSIPAYLSLWDELPEKCPGRYDVVLCRGNSLIGITGYGEKKEIGLEATQAKMKDALAGMFEKVTPGGFLYVDMPASAYSKPKESYDIFDTDHETYEIRTTVSYDPATKLRRSFEEMTHLVDGSKVTSVGYVYPLNVGDLIEMLHATGFSRVEKSPIEEAFYIDAYLAFKD